MKSSSKHLQQQHKSQLLEKPLRGEEEPDLVLQLCDLVFELADVLARVRVVQLALDLPFFFLLEPNTQLSHICRDKHHIFNSSEIKMLVSVVHG